MSYDNWKLQAPDEGQDLGDDVECIHGVDLFAPCVKCKPLAANGGEGDDMSEDNSDVLFGGFVKPLKECSPISLVSMRNAIDTELKQRRELLAKELAATEHALNGTRPRATRRDKGTTRAPKEHAA
jgi:hypothetical protein